MAITLTEGTCLQVPDLDEWQLLGRVQMRSDMPSELKITVVAYHRHTGRLARFYMIRPKHPDGLDPLDYSSDPDSLPGYTGLEAAVGLGIPATRDHRRVHRHR
jgi:hypothetical protein